MARFQAGDAQAFSVLVRRYERELYGYLRRYLGDGNLAEDVFQNTFLRPAPEARPVRNRPARPAVAVYHRHASSRGRTAVMVVIKR